MLVSAFIASVPVMCLMITWKISLIVTYTVHGANVTLILK